MVKFLKIRDVKSPQRRFGDAGIDVFIPNFSEEYKGALMAKNPNLGPSHFIEGIILNPGDSINIPLGLKTSFTPNLALEANNKSGVATRKVLIVGASVIDSSYQGEIHAHLINVGKVPQVLNYGEKITQFIPRLIDISDHEVYSGITSEEFYSGVKTERGEGGFGSSGNS